MLATVNARDSTVRYSAASKTLKGVERLTDQFAISWTAVFIAGAVGFAAIGIMFLANYLLAPRRPSADKGIPYESGIRPAPYSWSQLHFRYYIFAIFFLIFDVEAVFLFPWAVVFLGNKIAFYAMLIFLAVLFFALIYGWRKGVLEWRK